MKNVDFQAIRYYFNYFYAIAVKCSTKIKGYAVAAWAWAREYIMKMICVPDLVFVCVYGPELLATLQRPFA